MTITKWATTCVPNRAAYMDECRKMMQAWVDYLDALRTDSNVVSTRKAN